jgi:hypothetical protein
MIDGRAIYIMGQIVKTRDDENWTFASSVLFGGGGRFWGLEGGYSFSGSQHVIGHSERSEESLIAHASPRSFAAIRMTGFASASVSYLRRYSPAFSPAPAKWRQPAHTSPKRKRALVQDCSSLARFGVAPASYSSGKQQRVVRNRGCP